MQSSRLWLLSEKTPNFPKSCGGYGNQVYWRQVQTWSVKWGDRQLLKDYRKAGVAQTIPGSEGNMSILEEGIKMRHWNGPILSFWSYGWCWVVKGCGIVKEEIGFKKAWDDARNGVPSAIIRITMLWYLEKYVEEPRHIEIPNYRR